MAGVRTAFAVLAYTGGIVLADAVRPGSRDAFAAGGFGVGCLLAAAFAQWRRRNAGQDLLLPAVRPAAVALVGVGLAGVGFCSLGLRLAAQDAAQVPRRAGEAVDLIGRLATDPRPDEYSNRFDLAVREVGGLSTKEKVAVTAYGRLRRMSAGDRIGLRGKVIALDESDGFDTALARKSIVAKVSVPATDIRLLEAPRNPALSAANFFRLRIRAAAEKGAGPDTAGLVLGLVIGDQRDIRQPVLDDFRAAGLSHLTAVSGQNVAMVLAPLVLFMTAIRLGRRTQMTVSLVILGLFVVVTRWEPSVLRAALMASAALSAWLFGRRSDAAHLLGVACFALLAVDPLLLWSIGFQLSFAATAGILLIGPVLAQRLGRPFDRPLEPGRGARPKTSGVRGRVVQAAAIGIAAQVAVLPFIAWHFGRVSLVSLPANLVALPLVAPLMVLGLAGGVAGMVSVQAGWPFMWLAGLLVSALEAVARLFGRSAYAQVSVEEWGLLQLSALVATIVGGGIWLHGRGRAARWPAVIAAATAVFAGLLPEAGSTPTSGMRIRFFDVGQGDAALVEGPSGARILVDGGPDRGHVAGRLRRMGFRRLDLVIASHGHADHVDGLGEVFRRMEVSTIVDPGIRTRAMERAVASAGPGRLETASDNEGMNIGDLAVDFFGPRSEERMRAAAEQTEPSSEGSSLNDASVVARVSFGRACALFTGDLEERGQEVLLAAHPAEIDCTVLKAPHHGSGRLLARFVQAVDPEWVPISVGRNDYGHPAPRALSLFRRVGATVLRTDRAGDIVLNVGRDGRVTLVK